MHFELATLLFVFLFSSFQSVAGVGLLLFGTPTLMLMGYPFDETLAIVVPTSLVISILQLSGQTAISSSELLSFSVKTAPPLIAGLSAVLLLGFENQLHFPVAAGLAAGVVLQVYNLFSERTVVIPKKIDWAIVGGIGLIHGLTNLGGGFLAAYSSIRNTNRLAVRSTVALGYSIFAILQISLLLLLSPESFSVLTLGAMCVGGVVYLLLGRRLFAATSEGFFKMLMPVVTSFFCISVLATGFSLL